MRYSAAFPAAARQRGIERVEVFHALNGPMQPEAALRSASWHPLAHMSDPPFLYRAWVPPSAVVRISVGHELHPIVSVRPGTGSVRVRVVRPT